MTAIARRDWKGRRLFYCDGPRSDRHFIMSRWDTVTFIHCPGCWSRGAPSGTAPTTFREGTAEEWAAKVAVGMVIEVAA